MPSRSPLKGSIKGARPAGSGVASGAGSRASSAAGASGVPALAEAGAPFGAGLGDGAGPAAPRHAQPRKGAASTNGARMECATTFAIEPDIGPPLWSGTRPAGPDRAASTACASLVRNVPRRPPSTGVAPGKLRLQGADAI